MPKQTFYIMIGIFSGLFLAALDQTIVATALPKIVEDLGGTNLYAWVATCYLITLTASLPIFGRLIDIYDGKRVLLCAIAFFLLGSVLSGLSMSMIELLAFRALQGIGAGGLFSVVLSILGILFSPRERGKVQGYFGMVFGLSSVIGPLLGGLISDYISWHWIFFINVPIGFISIIIIMKYMPKLPPKEKCNFDFPGAIFLSIWTIALLLICSLPGQRFKAFPWTLIIPLSAVFLISFISFVLTELRSKYALFDLRLLRESVFRRTYISLFLFGSVFIAVVLFIPLYLVKVKGISVTSAGLVLVPLTAGVVISSVAAGQLASITGRYKIFLVFSNIWLMIFLFLFSHYLKATLPVSGIILFMIAIGLGIGPGMPLYTLAVQNAAKRERIGSASSASQFFRQIGASLGVAILGGVLALNLNAAGFGNSFNGVESSTFDNINPAQIEIIKQVVSDSISQIYRYCAILMSAVSIITLFIPDRQLRSSSEQ